MSLSQKGANYQHQSALQRRDRELGRALDDLASQIQAVRAQGQFGQTGPPKAPHPLAGIAVTNENGFVSVALTHNAPPPGARYIIQYSTDSNFGSYMQVDAGPITEGNTLTWQQYLKGQTLYFRAAPMFPASQLAPWMYFGGPAQPTAVSI